MAGIQKFHSGSRQPGLLISRSGTEWGAGCVTTDSFSVTLVGFSEGLTEHVFVGVFGCLFGERGIAVGAHCDLSR